MKFKAIILVMMLAPMACFSATNPEIYRDELTLTGGAKNLDEVLEGCEQHSGYFKAQRVQYSDSGSTIKVIQFKRGDGEIFAIPTNFENLSKAQYSDFSRLVREGVNYWIKFSVCGSGGYMSLIDINTSVGM